MTNVRAWQATVAGRIDSLRLTTERLGDLAADRIRVRCRAIGLNFADIFALAGLYSATPRVPFIPGFEVAGDVEAVGPEVPGFRPGDRVMALVRFGAYADRVDVDPRYARPLPPGWSHVEGAAFLAQTLTAWYALRELGDARAGELTLVHSAAGGVGLQALAICRALRVPVIGTVGSEEKREFLRGRGFDEVLVRGRQFAARLRRQLRGRPLLLVLDAVGGSVQRRSFEALAPRGRLVVYGAAEFTPGRSRPRYLDALRRYLVRPRYDVLGMISANRSVMAFNLVWLWQEWELFGTMLRAIEALSLPAPFVGREFRFADAARAVETLRGGRTIGKVVLVTG